MNLYCLTGNVCLSNALDPIIEIYNKKPSIQKLQKKVEAKERALEAALKKPQDLVIVSNSNPPKHILHLIFKLSTVEQKKFFQYDGYENALMYALAHEPEALSEFELDEESKQQAILARIKPNNDSGLIVAAKLGAINAINLLISWGSDIESQDSTGLTALHWAAANGDVEAVNCLVKNGSKLEALTQRNNTPLNAAVINGKSAVVNLLLKESNLNTRNIEGKNSLDLAIDCHPELVEPILMQIATQPISVQMECLNNVPGGPYPNVLFYVAANKSELFYPLINQTLGQPDHPLRNTLIENTDKTGLTALHWAATNGNVEAVNCLVENGSKLEALTQRKNTPLNAAIINGKSAVVNLLLKKSNLNTRNINGKNALDLAIDCHPELVEPILMQIATQPIAKQTECLNNVPGGPYPNVFFFAATVNTKLLKTLLHSFNKSVLDSKMQHIHENIHQIGLHYQKMKRKSSKNLNLNYKAAVSTAETLLNTSIDKMLEVYQSRDNADVKMLEFKNSCKGAIETARPVLTKYREWGKVLAAFLLAVITLPISLPLYAAGFFSVKTKSEQLLDNLQIDVNKL
jgi:ankyrin repeat protein